jgi:SGNH domain (fused to AT3 domains)
VGGGIAATSRTLAAAGSAVTVLGDVPGLAADPTDCILRRKATMATCTFDRSMVIARYNGSAEDGAGLGRARYVDPQPWFCADNRCPEVIGAVAYSETNHVSRTYARRLAEPLARALRLTAASR